MTTVINDEKVEYLLGYKLTHCGLVTLYGDIDLAQH